MSDGTFWLYMFKDFSHAPPSPINPTKLIGIGIENGLGLDSIRQLLDRVAMRSTHTPTRHPIYSECNKYIKPFKDTKVDFHHIDELPRTILNYCELWIKNDQANWI